MPDSCAARASRPPWRKFPPGAVLAFVTEIDAPTRIDLNQAYDSSLASTRLRVIVPAHQLAQRVPVWLVPFEHFLRNPELSALGPTGALVLGKLPAGGVVRQQAALEELRLRWCATPSSPACYADLSDDLAALGNAMRQPFLAAYQNWLGEECTLIAPCAALAARLAPKARRGVVVIEDPYENEERPVHTPTQAPLRLMWFGNLGVLNAQWLEAEFAALAAAFAHTELQLEIVAHADVSELVHAMCARLHAAHLRLNTAFSAWSLPVVAQALERCDFVLIPQDLRSAWGQVKSHNRLVTAIRAGRLALASPIPSYRELADYAWVGENLASGLRWALASPVHAAARVRAGQRYVAQRFSPETIGRKWAAMLGIQ